VSTNSVPLSGDCCADSQCESGNCCGGVCRGKGTGKTGETCCDNVNCASGFCNPNQRCSCQADSDCGSGQYCDPSVGCTPTRGPCASCNRNSQCTLPATCFGGNCVGNGNGGQLGDDCCVARQCQSGSCSESGHCQCLPGPISHCPAGQFCQPGATDDDENHCVPLIGPCSDSCCWANWQCASLNGKPGVCINGGCVVLGSVGIGGNCCRDAQCATGECRAGHCVCGKNSDCPSSQICQVNSDGNTCVRGQDLCEICSSLPCIPGLTCSSGLCIKLAVLNLGDSCCRSLQCRKGLCGPDNVCVCNSNTDCDTGFQCFHDYDGFGRHRCIKFAECGMCLSTSNCPPTTQCLSGRCAGNDQKLPGQACCNGVQCRSGICNFLGKCH